MQNKLKFHEIEWQGAMFFFLALEAIFLNRLNQKYQNTLQSLQQTENMFDVISDKGKKRKKCWILILWISIN